MSSKGDCWTVGVGGGRRNVRSLGRSSKRVCGIVGRSLGRFAPRNDEREVVERGASGTVAAARTAPTQSVAELFGSATGWQRSAVPISLSAFPVLLPGKKMLHGNFAKVFGG